MGNPEDERVTSPAIAADRFDADVPKGFAASGTVDAALEFLQAEGGAILSEIDEKKLVRKIDWMIMPLMWACYNLQYLDKVLSTEDPVMFYSIIINN
jgi:hypothetical protein